MPAFFRLFCLRSKGIAQPQRVGSRSNGKCPRTFDKRTTINHVFPLSAKNASSELMCVLFFLWMLFSKGLLKRGDVFRPDPATSPDHGGTLRHPVFREIQVSGRIGVLTHFAQPFIGTALIIGRFEGIG